MLLYNNVAELRQNRGAKMRIGLTGPFRSSPIAKSEMYLAALGYGAYS
jgi:hypothetical protein